jgi:hypothetical protein
MPYENYAPAGDGWWLTGWTYTQGGEQIGVAIGGSGTHVTDVAALRGKRPAVMKTLDGLSATRVVAPLFVASVVTPGVTADTAAMGVLCQTFAQRPAWRTQLGDPQRVTAFLSDLATREHKPLVTRTGVRRRTVETCIAMLQLGPTQPIQGRPLPGQVFPPEDEVVHWVTRKVVDNPYALRGDEAKIRAIVKRKVDRDVRLGDSHAGGGQEHVASSTGRGSGDEQPAVHGACRAHPQAQAHGHSTAPSRVAIELTWRPL